MIFVFRCLWISDYLRNLTKTKPNEDNKWGLFCFFCIYLFYVIQNSIISSQVKLNFYFCINNKTLAWEFRWRNCVMAWNLFSETVWKNRFSEMSRTSLLHWKKGNQWREPKGAGFRVRSHGFNKSWGKSRAIILRYYFVYLCTDAVLVSLTQRLIDRACEAYWAGGWGFERLSRAGFVTGLSKSPPDGLFQCENSVLLCERVCVKLCEGK